MKNIVVARAAFALLPFALLAGLVLGGLGPRRELEEARREIERMKSRPERAGGAGSLNVITDVVRIPPRPATETRAPQSPATDGTAERPAPGAADLEPTASAPERPAERISLRERLETAREAWAVRVDVARNTFAARTGYRGEELAEFDTILAAMNLRLRNTFEQFARQLAAGEELTVERGVRMVNELTGALALTYDELDRKLPSAWRAAAGDDFDLTDFIDPSVAEPLIPVESQIENRPRRRGPRRPGRP